VKLGQAESRTVLEQDECDRIETSGAGANSLARNELQNQDRHWSRHAPRYDDLFVDPYDPAVESPLRNALEAVPDAWNKTVADLGCGTGPLLPYLAERFSRVIALDFAPGMLARAAERLGSEAVPRVTFLKRPMHQLDDLAGQLDVAVAVNSLVMPDVRLIDRTLQSIRASLKPGGQFLGVVPSIDTIYYHLMLLMDQSIDQGLETKEAKRFAGLHAERKYYDFAFGEFHFEGLRQKFWQPFELEYRLAKAGFTSTTLGKVLYPWEENLAGSETLVGIPRSWDWFFMART
jgi:SAM-dependent methyltransferase